MKILKQLSILTLILMVSVSFGQDAPYFTKGQDPKPEGATWKKIKKMSDEFNGKKVDEGKWQISGQGWIGRAPGLFLADNIKVGDGNLQVTSTKLPKPVVKQGKTFTHGGGYVGSWKGMTYGYYECRMKANKTFMSSTFWLINDRNETTGCDKRTTELDIQECVGQMTGDQEFIKKMLNHMNSNTHSRGIKEGCDIPSGSIGAKAPLNELASDDYHVYGVWWKNKNEVLFFLDGKFQSKVKPEADFSIPMHLRMVVETYNWNPVPADGGMTGSKEDRTTLYDWVRSWKLVD
ncbi:family 16 glycosylhydrolase [Seonamhaeicola maritimus]|uniref:Family 16 glycosylhydrolase n=1 Tax=Seonamhaeicola maritimus TaxID=2591822 RepID=A0A5C7GGW6_9FLAO|nr:family 16 glycosylhydrolase [Seonamhaeicola maritimus]TXG36080.1 family 16 glycosylhydrolase [Seonamhaeicola maritimus]